MTRLAPADLGELRDQIAWALAAQEPIELVAGRSKRGLGRPVQVAHQLDLAGLSGIRDYAPSELVLTAGAGTPLADIERALEEAGQMLAFEPPDWRGLLGAGGQDGAGPTLGGGSRRGRRATISSVFGRSAGAARSSRPAARSSRTSPVTICRN